LILATLKACDGNKVRAAGMLKISLKTLYNRLNEYGAPEAPTDPGASLPPDSGSSAT
jgi:DNA-binding NtrC family response regulator